MAHKAITELKFKPLTRKIGTILRHYLAKKGPVVAAGACSGDSNALSSRRVRVKKTRER
ncbi:MAG: hypothetical protein HW396_677 [Candidatus Dadabacteria bacterium]|nr:hypothetical protein [Candidatus Dadabacteria bacterium]